MEKELNDLHGLAVALNFAAMLAYFEHDPAEVERLASDLIELSTRQNFAHWLTVDSFSAVGRAALRAKQPKASRGLRTELETLGPKARYVVCRIFWY